MAYIGASPPATALTASDIADGIISEAKMANDAISLAELKAGTDGEVISWDASGNPVAIGAGTSGHFLKSQGAGSQPVFAAASSGLNLLLTTTVSGTSTGVITFGSSYITATYNTYLIVGTLKGISDATMHLRFQTSGSDVTTADYYGWDKFQLYNSATEDASDGQIDIGPQDYGNQSAEGGSINCWLYHPMDAAITTAVTGASSTHGTSGTHLGGVFSGIAYTAEANNGISFYPSTGNFAANSELSIYGLSK